MVRISRPPPRTAATYDESFNRSDITVHQYRSRNRLDVTLLGVVEQRGSAVSRDAQSDLMDSRSATVRAYIRRGHRLHFRRILRHQDVPLVNGAAVDRRLDLRHSRQFRRMVVHI